MKRRWHRIPIALVVGLLVLTLTAGIALAAGFPFFTGKVQAEVEEAIAVGAFDSWDNLHPYGSDESAVWEDSGAHDDGTGVLGDVRISIMPDGDAYKLIVETLGSGDKLGSGFVAGE